MRHFNVCKLTFVYFYGIVSHKIDFFLAILCSSIENYDKKKIDKKSKKSVSKAYNIPKTSMLRHLTKMDDRFPDISTVDDAEFKECHLFGRFATLSDQQQSDQMQLLQEASALEVR